MEIFNQFFEADLKLESIEWLKQIVISYVYVTEGLKSAKFEFHIKFGSNSSCCVDAELGFLSNRVKIVFKKFDFSRDRF